MTMKTIYKVFACASAALALASCSDFLKESSQDQIRPKNASDYKELIAGEIYYKMNEYSPQNAWLDAMTDDCEELAKKASTFAPDKRIAAFGYYTWQQEPERQREGVLNSDGAWGLYYHQIFTCNMILNDVDDMEGTPEEKAQVKAEAYMIRAYAYYMLVNLYGEPYDPKTADKAAGVPVNGLIGVENKKFKRESVAAIYDQILANGENALKQFEICGDGNSVFRWNKAAAEVFLSRVCLYMQNWEDAAKYANAALSIKADIWDLNQKAVDDASIDSYSYMDRFFTSRNPEILFSFGYATEKFSAEGAGSCYPPSAELRAMYIDGDLRGGKKGMYIRWLGGFLNVKKYAPFKSYITSYTSRYGQAIRTVEAYLNRAEAYSHMDGKSADALEDVERIRVNRIKPDKYVPLAATSKEDIIQAVRDERRREMCFERLRWFDLRRWGRPSITHTYTPDIKNPTETETYVLQENDPAYTLPVPKEVLEMEPELTDIERPVRNPQATA